jgi:hypothetical protein
MGRTIARLLLVALLVTTAPGPASSGCSGPKLRTFTPEERQRLETQYGPTWWKALGLIPGPETADDYVQQPSGDSVITVYAPQRFWDPRGGCATGSQKPPEPPARQP